MSTTIDYPEVERDFIHPPDTESAIRTLQQLATQNRTLNGSEVDHSDTDDCTYETQETDELEEAQEAEESQESIDLVNKEELDTLGPRLFVRIDDIILTCRVSNGGVNVPLFRLAHEVRSIEDELNRRFSLDVYDQIVRRWEADASSLPERTRARKRSRNR